MPFKERCEAANVEVVKPALFITRNSLKSHGERNLFSPSSNPCAITQKLCTYSRPKFFEKSPGYEIEITCGTQFSVTHAAPSDVSLPAVSSIGGLRTPAPGARGTAIMGPASADLHSSGRSLPQLPALGIPTEP